ncbi:hypothetical protein D0Z00_004670 [Geotrichum galactomycetum]|uniref:Uncharacterized protein n=1 Tax=Geotrichum galactomycetum TaxID=27317 RepID=A0ACB6UXS7_9ASCO|nr:hypothetical protein D0Z00_004670 [Geotrichum candidum]
MAGGRNCIIFFFPMIGNLAAIILSLVVILGGVRNVSVLRDLYFFKLDLSHVTSKAIVGDSGLSSVVSTSLIDTAIQEALSALNISSFYTAALWGYCEGDISSTNATNVTACSHPEALWWLDVQKILDESLSSTSVNITLPSELTDYNPTIEAASKAMFICYLVSIIVLFLGLIAGGFAFHSRGGSCCAGLITLVGAVASLIASGIATGLYIVIRNAINDNTSEYGLVASLNSTMMGLTWGATVAAIWAFVWWILTICCGSTRKSYEPEKEPFIQTAYIPPRGY